MTGLRFGDLLLESGNGLAIVAGSDRRDRGFERTGFLDAPRPHVFQKLRPDFGLFDQIKKRDSLRLVYSAAVSVVSVAAVAFAVSVSVAAGSVSVPLATAPALMMVDPL